MSWLCNSLNERREPIFVRLEAEHHYEERLAILKDEAIEEGLPWPGQDQLQQVRRCYVDACLALGSLQNVAFTITSHGLGQVLYEDSSSLRRATISIGTSQHQLKITSLNAIEPINVYDIVGSNVAELFSNYVRGESSFGRK